MEHQYGHKYLVALMTAAAVIVGAFTGAAQTMGHDHDHTSGTGKRPQLAPSYAWNLIAPLGLREESTIDTLFVNYSRRSVPSEVTDAWATSGNLGSEGLDMIFANRPARSDFFFRDAFATWLPSHNKTRYYNTRIPMTLLSYNASGGRETAQELLSMTFSGNINSKAQVGAMLDYLYSKGSYANQATKDLNWGFSGSYLGDRYEMQAYFYHYNLLNKENGGITNMLYIEDPAEMQGGVDKIDAKSIPTKLSNAFTRVTGQEFYLNNRYKVGYWKEDIVDDTVTVRSYVPVTSFIHTFKFTSGKHLFIDKSSGEVHQYFENSYLNPDGTRDKTTYWNISNTLGVSMLEGFNPKIKFGLAAYARLDVRRYNMPEDTLDRNVVEGLTPWPEGVSPIANRTTETLGFVGAQLTKQKGRILRYEATAEFGIMGPVAGDVRADGFVTTRIPMRSDSLSIKAFGGFRNEETPFLLRQYRSNHFIWHNSFGKQRTVELGGEIDYSLTHTRFCASVQNIQNHVYFGPDGQPRQHGGSVQVLSLGLRQNFKVGVLHWDNSVNYQTTSDDAVIPLPTLTVYSNLYIKVKIATLHLQLGVDCDYYTRYYAPQLQPATASFANQREIKIGNYPFCNAYANMKLGKTRFYVLFSHVNQGLFGGNGYFSMPYYPLNPRRFQIGLSVDFAN